jgi:glycosyltransferase involved in cell wall biosynthesis/SAM-dependent methyltransferase
MLSARASRPPDAPSEDAELEYADVATYFDTFAPVEARWRRANATYHRLVEQICRSMVPEGRKVLEIGSGGGDLLAALRPSTGVGLDVSREMVELARSRHPDLRFEVEAGERAKLDETFDYIVLSDVVPYVHDLLRLLETAREHSHQRTRIVINSYNPAWRPFLGLAERLRLKPRKPIRNWVSPADVRNLLELAGFQVVSASTRILMPKDVPLLTPLLNTVVANIWPFTRLCVSYWIVARPSPESQGELGVSVVCACRNEAGHIPQLVDRLPAIGAATELIFVEGGSTDDTREAIEREIEQHPELDISLLTQPGTGKGDAVRTGFAAAKHEALMILDADLTVQPEDLTKFYDALVANRGELINGSRLVYDMEQGSMRFLNMLGNKAFSLAFRWITGQHLKDMLCGTKVLHRDDYAAIAAGRSFFGDFDPFGDFDLLFGAARLNLKIVDLPVRYGARTYGTTNISRFRHGLLLLRMTAFAYSRFRVRIYRRPPRRQRRSSATRQRNASRRAVGRSTRSSADSGR